jgi:hypothetical protein
MIATIDLSGNETDEQMKQIAWQMFCWAHPVEAHQHDAEKFWKYFHERVPELTREQMLETLKECEK